MLLKVRWETLPACPESRLLAADLDRFKWPSIGWRHDSGGIPILLSEGAKLDNMPANKGWPGLWTLHSAYQGFLFGVGPRIAKYLEAVSRVERFLRTWRPAPLPAPAVRAKPKPEADAAEPEAQADPPLEVPDEALVASLMVEKKRDGTAT